MKKLVYLRHTTTAYNEPPIRLRGILDVPLSPAGFAQIPTTVAAFTRAYPNVRQVYSSPLERAAILATALAHEYGLSVTKLDGLRSWNYGVLNGRHVQDVLPVLEMLSTGAGRELSPKDGESMNGVLERTAKCTQDIIYGMPEEGHVVVVTHLQNIMLSRAYLEAGLPDFHNLDYAYKETDEIQPGSWIEIHRKWVTQT